MGASTQAKAISIETLAVSGAAMIRHGLGIAAPSLAAGMVSMGLLFHREIAAAIDVWTGSTAYNHCALVVPIVAYLVWDRRGQLVDIAPRPMPAAALAGLPLAAAWLFAERLGIMEGRQLVAMTLLQLLLFAVLGWRLWWLLAGPLLYLYFLVPFGAFITPALQGFTARFVMHGLDLLGIANYTDGYTIQIPEGTFYVAEACAGLRFLIASIAFGCLYSLLLYRSPLRRATFVVVSVVVPIIANGVRELGIVLLGHVLGSAEAAETDHILYGWLFFSVVILLLVTLGLPFREDRVEAPARARGPATTGRPGVGRPGMGAAAAGVCIAAIGPLIATT
ncbi:MAG: exosortase, partial [Pseudomonadota bacterium]|nr:exosortase [Pseudomonadota bacterium]